MSLRLGRTEALLRRKRANGVIALNRSALALTHVNRHGTSVNRSRPGWSRLSAPELSAGTGRGARHLFAREPDEHAGGMELRTGNSNQRHGEIVCRAGDCAQRQFGSPSRRVGLRCGSPAAGIP
jgi:hypothetical protein